MNHFHVTVNIPVIMIRERNQVVAYSPALDLSTAADDVFQAKIAFEEALDMFLEDLIERGTLEEVLTDLGWEMINNEFIPPEIIGQAESIRRSLSM